MTTKLRSGLVLLAAPLLALVCSGCLVVGHSSSGGWFVWPGGIGLLVIILVIGLLMRRR